MQFTDLRCKEVICLADGQRMGFVSDVQIELPNGCVTAIRVPVPCRLWGLWGRQEDYLIPWRCIRRIGPDIVLVDVDPQCCRVKRCHPKGCFFL